MLNITLPSLRTVSASSNRKRHLYRPYINLTAVSKQIFLKRTLMFSGFLTLLQTYTYFNNKMMSYDGSGRYKIMNT